MTKFSLVDNNGAGSITVLIDGELYSATNTHPNYDEIVELCLEGLDPAPELFDPSMAVNEYFRVTDRLSVADGNVYFDGDVVHGTLVNQILSFIENDLEYFPLVLFYEKLAQNPSERSREQLYDWLVANGSFTIAKNGDIVGYKGIYLTDVEGAYKSASSGHAIVNGVSQTGQIHQQEGDTVEMPRSKVADNASIGCSTGLHVGTFQYAQEFTGNVVLVYVNPRDVVSVPTDCGAQKMRVCRYVVGPVQEVKIEEPLWDWTDDENPYSDYESDLVDDVDDSDLEKFFYTDSFEFTKSGALGIGFYDEGSSTAFISFAGKPTYFYGYEITPTQWNVLKNSESPGALFHSLNAPRFDTFGGEGGRDFIVERLKI